jgi:L-ascorbate metabolism protein UlaG (beta-lactamase superfamily)
MEFGQYNPTWESVHELPYQVIKATEELHAKQMVPVHHSKFTLARHPWDEPLKLATELSQNKEYKLATPMIGEVLWLNDTTQQFKQWWDGIG